LINIDNRPLVTEINTGFTMATIATRLWRVKQIDDCLDVSQTYVCTYICWKKKKLKN
jgi:hypothetical protein